MIYHITHIYDTCLNDAVQSDSPVSINDSFIIYLLILRTIINWSHVYTTYTALYRTACSTIKSGDNYPSIKVHSIYIISSVKN